MSRIENALEKSTSLHARPQPVPQTVALGRRPDERADPPFVPKNPCIVTLTEPDSPIAEEYRKLKTTVIRLAMQNTKQHALMVTSSVSGEGKSLTAINLAVSLAQDVGMSVLLIDADLRRPNLMEYLGIKVKTGLTECLREGVPVLSAVIKSGIPRLDLLMAGKGVRNPVELLSSPSMRSLFEELKRQAPERSIIIDSPPVLPFAETQVLSSLVDSVLFVVREGATTVQELQDALEIIEGAKVLGIVFNGVTDRTMNNRYYHYYRYYAEQRHQQT